MKKKIEKVVKNSMEFQNVVEIYETQGYTCVSRSETECVFKKKIRTKKWSFKKLALVKLVITFCTLFTVSLIYNWLHTKKEIVTIKIQQN